jgi:hypothetical protein
LPCSFFVLVKAVFEETSQGVDCKLQIFMWFAGMMDTLDVHFLGFDKYIITYPL